MARGSSEVLIGRLGRGRCANGRGKLCSIVPRGDRGVGPGRLAGAFRPGPGAPGTGFGTDTAPSGAAGRLTASGYGEVGSRNRSLGRAELVGVRGFEPPTSATRTQRSTKLSHTPSLEAQKNRRRPRGRQGTRTVRRAREETFPPRSSGASRTRLHRALRRLSSAGRDPMGPGALFGTHSCYRPRCASA